MGERTDSRELKKILNDSQTENSSLSDLKETAEKIKTTSMQFDLSEDEIASRQANLMRKIEKQEKLVTKSENLRLNRQTILKRQRRFAMAWVFIAISLLSLGGVGTVYASADALPGEVLYPVKIASEDIQLFFSDDEGDIDLLLNFMDERIQEMEKLSEEGNPQGMELALDGYQNEMEQMTGLMTKMQAEDPVAGDALHAEVQSRLEEQTQRMLHVDEAAGDQLQIQEQVQDRTETQDQLKSGVGDPETEDSSTGNGNQGNTNVDEQGSMQGEPQSQQKSNTQLSASLQAYELTEDGQFVLRFVVNGAQNGSVIVRVNGVDYACSGSQSSLVCQGPAPSDGTAQVEVLNGSNGTSLFRQWITVSRGNDSSSGSGNSDGQGGSGGKQH